MTQNKEDLKTKVLAFFQKPNRASACSINGYDPYKIREMIDALEVTGELEHIRNETHKIYRTKS